MRPLQVRTARRLTKIRAMNKNIFIVTDEQVGMRLDAFVASRDDSISRSAAVRLCEQGDITVNGKTVKKNYAVREGDEVEVILPDPIPAEAVPQDIPLDIVYEDEDIIVINKPEGMVVHPAAGNEDGTLVNALLYHCGDSLSGIGGVSRPGIVHRIDKDTAGLLVVAKNDAAHISLSDQLKRHEVSRIYSAIVIGGMREDSGTVNAPLGRDLRDRKKNGGHTRSVQAIPRGGDALERAGAIRGLLPCALSA